MYCILSILCVGRPEQTFLQPALCSLYHPLIKPLLHSSHLFSLLPSATASTFLPVFLASSPFLPHPHITSLNMFYLFFLSLCISNYSFPFHHPLHLSPSISQLLHCSSLTSHFLFPLKLVLSLVYLFFLFYTFNVYKKYFVCF